MIFPSTHESPPLAMELLTVMNSGEESQFFLEDIASGMSTMLVDSPTLRNI